MNLTRTLQLMAAPTWQFNFAAGGWPGQKFAPLWFVNRPVPEMVKVTSTGAIRNFAYTENWTGRMVQPFKCFNPLERKTENVQG